MTQTIHLPVTEDDGADPFTRRLAAEGQRLVRRSIDTLQLNLGRMCNLACHHCHVEAGPHRDEVMPWDVMAKVLEWVDRFAGQVGFKVVDLTGGAPEMNPHFRRLIEELTRRRLHVLDRSNLTILLEPGFEDLVDFLAAHRVEVVASLPCYLQENVDKQRGGGVFDGSIEALKRLNAAGYGRDDDGGDGGDAPGAGLRLDLVYNPVGYGLPPAQAALEADYKSELGRRFGVTFNRLWTITNMPIKRFEHQLRRDGQLEAYMAKLDAAHNADNVQRVMCRDLVSVGWLGAVYDCDFNQMLQMPISAQKRRRQFGPGDDEYVVESRSRKLWEYTAAELIGRPIRTGGHCFGCTAGAGSSCTGTLE